MTPRVRLKVDLTSERMAARCPICEQPRRAHADGCRWERSYTVALGNFGAACRALGLTFMAAMPGGRAFGARLVAEEEAELRARALAPPHIADRILSDARQLHLLLVRAEDTTGLPAPSLAEVIRARTDAYCRDPETFETSWRVEKWLRGPAGWTR